MAIEDMNPSQTDYSLGQNRSWEKEINLSGPGESNWISIPETIRSISLTVSFTGGASGKIQTTTDLLDILRNGSPIPIDWPYGEICCNERHVCNPCSGIKIIQIQDGSMKTTIRAQ